MTKLAMLFATLVVVLVAPTPTSAQSYVSRPLTTGGGHLDLYAGPAPKPVIEDAGFNFASGPNDLLFNLGLAFGITDDIEIGAYPLRLRLFDDAEIANPYIWGTFRLVSGRTEVGIRPVVPIPIFDSEFWVRLAIPVVFHISEHARIETGGELGIAFRDPVALELFIPLRLVLNLSSQFFFGLDTGLRLPIAPDGRASIPFGVFLGYTVTAGVDLGLAVRWPGFVEFGRGRAVNGRDPDLTLGVNIYGLL